MSDSPPTDQTGLWSKLPSEVQDIIIRMSITPAQRLEDHTCVDPQSLVSRQFWRAHHDASQRTLRIQVDPGISKSRYSNTSMIPHSQSDVPVRRLIIDSSHGPHDGQIAPCACCNIHDTLLGPMAIVTVQQTKLQESVKNDDIEEYIWVYRDYSNSAPSHCVPEVSLCPLYTTARAKTGSTLVLLVSSDRYPLASLGSSRGTSRAGVESPNPSQVFARAHFNVDGGGRPAEHALRSGRAADQLAALHIGTPAEANGEYCTWVLAPAVVVFDLRSLDLRSERLAGASTEIDQIRVLVEEKLARIIQEREMGAGLTDEEREEIKDHVDKHITEVSYGEYLESQDGNAQTGPLGQAILDGSRDAV